MYVLGTAGHVDHGKSTLIEALSGIDPDRLAEEKAREMTIDLGFAWMELDINGEREEVGIIDVPGHRDFIENMLAGIGGIDLALFVVAADEGVMPQTSEHLSIIDLLEVPAGIVALTKVDLIADPDWLELVVLDLQEKLAGTVLAEAPIVHVSAQTGAGLPELRNEIATKLSHTEARPDRGFPRLPIDRVFTLPGFGTIVTGTLSGGSMMVGDPVEVQPGKMRGRIRGLQTHKTKRESVAPGSRVAINISGIDAGDLRRGMVVAYPEQLRDTILIDVTYRHLDSVEAPLKHNFEVKLFTGATEVMARTRVLGTRSIEAGMQGYLQLALDSPIAVARGDHFILRRPSPGVTLGGGTILDPHPGRRHRRFQARVLQRLQTLAEGAPEDLLLQRLEKMQPVMPDELISQSALAQGDARQAWANLLQTEMVVILGGFAVTVPYLKQMQQRVTTLAHQYHQVHRLRTGIPREELRSRLQLPVAAFNALTRLLVEQEVIKDNGVVIFESEHQIVLGPTEQAKMDAMLDTFKKQGVNSPTVKESRLTLGDELYEAGLAMGHYVQISEDVVYRRTDLEGYVEAITTHLKNHESVTAAEVRDLLDTSRKYAIALLDHLDRQHITRRMGDSRILNKSQLRVE